MRSESVRRVRLICIGATINSRHDHVTGSGSGKPVQPGSTSDDRDDVDVLGTRVVGAVHDRSDGEGERHAVLGSGGGGCKEMLRKRQSVSGQGRHPTDELMKREQSIWAGH